MAVKHDLPVLMEMQVRNFTLYRNRSNIDIAVQPGVFCLAGANGLGKSTFLAALNFAYTGIVASPTRNFLGVVKYYKDSLTYSARFFDGRVSETDRSQADISIRFRIGRHEYYLTRNFFEPDALRELSITDFDGHMIQDTHGWDPKARQDAYARHVTNDTNLSDFKFFVFLQHFLLTFDERRHSLLWDTRASNLALYIAFGMHADDIDREEELRVLIDSADSNARNAQWQATIATNRLRALGGEITTGEVELRQSHDQLVADADNARDEANLAELQVADASLKAAEVGARHLALRSEYDRAFSQRLPGHRDSATHPSIRKTLSENICDVCGSESMLAIESIRTALANEVCPLCGSATSGAESIDFAALRLIDDALAAAKEEADKAQERFVRLVQEHAALTRRAADTAAELSNFEAAHSDKMPAITVSNNEALRQRRALESEYQSATRRRDEYRAQRDLYRDELQPVRARMSAAYREGELEFVPNFRRLAQRFIGLDLDISFETKQGLFALAVSVQGSRRRGDTELSESQRFFLDIALLWRLRNTWEPWLARPAC